MAMHNDAKELLRFLNKNPGIRFQIKAPHDKALFYAGNFFKPIWKEIEELKQRNVYVRNKTMLPEVLEKIAGPNIKHGSLLNWAKAIDPLEPWKENGFIVWRALSGIFASNASGSVSFMIGSNVTKENKVFAATEIPVLLKNHNIDQISKDLLDYYGRCVRSGNADINFGFMSG